jgi:hypothetical protein
MNEPVEVNVLRIIDGLETLGPSMAAEPLAAAAARRHHDAHDRANQALAPRRRGPGGLLPSRRAAGHVSRQWLYTQPELRARIEQLRDRRPSASATVPDDQRARERSLRQRNETLLADNRRLRAENQTLRDEPAVLYGELRARDER